jgi:hypothetical protein
MNKLRIIFMIILLAQGAFGTIRYVSKTGSSTPPYISWETASDSIQKCFNLCVDGDTVIVANGVYKESLIINAAITFIGSSMDSCLLSGVQDKIYTIRSYNNVVIQGFGISGRLDYAYRGIIQKDFYGSIKVTNCRIYNCYCAINTYQSSDTLRNLIISNVEVGIETWCTLQTCFPVLLNSLIYVTQENGVAWLNGEGGNGTLLNNIFIGKDDPRTGNSAGIYSATAPHRKLTVKNNLFIRLGGIVTIRMHSIWSDPYFVTNNVFLENRYPEINSMVLEKPRSNSTIRNNIFLRNTRAFVLEEQPNSDYNVFWENKKSIPPPYNLGLHDIKADPMFVKDSLPGTFPPNAISNADYHLQMHSPGIDAGDPNILDVDGSRSDIGMYGGPLGQSYQYLDLPPNPPRNIKYTANINEKKIIFTWKKNSESDFKEYHVFRDTVQGFTPDSAHLYLILPDSTLGDTAQFIDTYSGENSKYYYRIIATDNQGNESEPSDEISVIITGVDIIDVEIATDYRLYQNYPNPFNPNTVISYQLAVGSYVKVMVYDIKGELLEVLVNENKPAGYYEVEFNAGKYASGIYLYRIEAVDESGIPRFMDMKKMVLIK